MGAPNARDYYNSVGKIYADAVLAAGVKEVIFLSSIGANLGEKNGPIAGLYDQEQRLNRLKGVNVLHLRPGYFMENLFWNIGLIKEKGMNGSPLRGNVPINMIATKDIAQFAAVNILTGVERTFTQELLGERDVSMEEATMAIGKAIGKPELKYVQFPYEDAEKAMIGMGMGKGTAALFNEMYKGFNDGVILPTERRTKQNTTTTSIEEFAKVFAQAYNK